tara:strand:- start:1384 stop:1710 length:327 start_codon:yes stop_codon:yes gene_type:complete
MDIEFKDVPEVTENPDLKEAVECRNDLMSFIVQYVGEKTKPENNDVTVENIVDVFAADFPEFLMAVAEENWIRGYHQALEDVEEGERLLNTEENQEPADEEETTGEDE